MFNEVYMVIVTFHAVFYFQDNVLFSVSCKRDFSTDHLFDNNFVFDIKFADCPSIQSAFNIAAE